MSGNLSDYYNINTQGRPYNYSKCRPPYISWVVALFLLELLLQIPVTRERVKTVKKTVTSFQKFDNSRKDLIYQISLAVGKVLISDSEFLLLSLSLFLPALQSFMVPSQCGLLNNLKRRRKEREGEGNGYYREPHYKPVCQTGLKYQWRLDFSSPG